MLAVVFAVLLGGLVLASSVDGAYGASTTITLNALPPYVYAGDTVIFSGTLTTGGTPLPGRTVQICEDDPFVPDECLARGMTDGQGRYHMTWTAEAGIVETDFDIYAEFKGDGSHERDQTPRYTMGVYKHGGSLVLDTIPARAAYGEVVTFSGTLRLDAHSPKGAVVYIKDEDAFNPDDSAGQRLRGRVGALHHILDRGEGRSRLHHRHPSRL